MKHLGLISLVIMAAVVLAGCPKPDAAATGQPAPAAAAPPPVDNSLAQGSAPDSAAAAATASGTQATPLPEGEVSLDNQGELQLPEGWPDYIPVYPGASVKLARSVGGGDVVTLHLDLITADKPDDVLAYYDEQVLGQGFVNDTQLKNPQGGTHSYKKETEKLTVTAMAGKEKTDVMLIYAPR